MHQCLGAQGQCRAGGSESHIWAHWKEAAQSIIKLLINYLNFPWMHWNQLQRWAHTVEVQLALGRPPSLGCNHSTFWCHKSSICGSNMPDGLKYTVLNIPTPLTPHKATKHQACSKHRTESPQTWASDGKIKYSVQEISSPVCVANWFVLLTDPHFPSSFK